MQARIAALSLTLLTLAACGGGADPRLEPLATANLEVGRGLGDLRLNETTLSEVIERYGTGAVSLLASDEAGFELALAGGQLDLLFGVPDEWYRDGAPLREAIKGLPAFIETHPEYGELKLSSLAVSANRSGSSFHTGALDRGGRVGGPITEVMSGYGPPPNGPGPFVAGMSPGNSDERALYPDIGLLVHYRSHEVDAESDEPPPPPTIESIALFLPPAP